MSSQSWLFRLSMADISYVAREVVCHTYCLAEGPQGHHDD